MIEIPASIAALFASNQFLQGGAILGAAGIAAAYARKIPALAYTQLKKYCTHSVQVDNRDRCFEWMRLWVQAQEFNQKARHMVASVVFQATDDDGLGGRNKGSVIFTPAPSTHWVWRDGSLLSVTLTKEKMGKEGGGDGGAGGGSTDATSFHETIVIRSYLTRSKEPLLQLIREGQALSQNLCKDHVRVYAGGRYSRWSLLGLKPKRKKDSVILNQAQLDELLTDVQLFHEDQDWYQDRGIPWKRGYLLYGPPGNGKSSIVQTIASEFNADIYYINLAEMGMSDGDLIQSLSEVPPGGIVVMEEIDTVFKGREAQGQKKNQAGGITFAGLLNAIDGITAQEGRVLFMTTNHRENLDPALIRPGRVDKQLYIGCASRNQMARMFKRFYPEHAAYAEEFARNLPEDLISMAQLQEYFMTYRGRFHEALVRSDELIALAQKAKDDAQRAAAAQAEAAKIAEKAAAEK